MTVNNEFSDNVANAFSSLIDFSANALQSAGSLVTRSIQSNEVALANSVKQSDNALDRIQLGNASLVKDALPLVTVAVLGFVAISLFKKGK